MAEKKVPAAVGVRLASEYMGDDGIGGGSLSYRLGRVLGCWVGELPVGLLVVDLRLGGKVEEDQGRSVGICEMVCWSLGGLLYLLDDTPVAKAFGRFADLEPNEHENLLPRNLYRKGRCKRGIINLLPSQVYPSIL
jgi:hypothetical protein